MKTVFSDDALGVFFTKALFKFHMSIATVSYLIKFSSNALPAFNRAMNLFLFLLLLSHPKRLGLSLAGIKYFRLHLQVEVLFCQLSAIIDDLVSFFAFIFLRY